MYQTFFFSTSGDFYAKSQTTSTKLPGLNAMLTLVGLEFEGQPHSGLDDAKNIARVLLRLIADRAFVRVNEKIIIKVMLSHSNVDHSTSSKISEILF